MSLKQIHVLHCDGWTDGVSCLSAFGDLGGTSPHELNLGARNADWLVVGAEHYCPACRAGLDAAVTVEDREGA